MSDSDSSSSDEEYDEKITEELCGTTPSFCNNVQRMKYHIYEIIVLSPTNEESDEAQDNTLLQKYVNALDIIYNSVTNINENKNNKNNINDVSTTNTEKMNTMGYSTNAINAVNTMVSTINEYVAKHNSLHMIAYLSYIKNQFRVFPFVQLPYFPE
jgi:DNA repair ATPase RecN